MWKEFCRERFILGTITFSLQAVVVVVHIRVHMVTVKRGGFEEKRKTAIKISWSEDD